MLEKAARIPVQQYLFRFLISALALSTLLLFACFPTHYDINAHAWSTARNNTTPEQLQLPLSLPLNITRTLVTGGLEPKAPAWLAKLPPNIDVWYRPVLDSSDGYVNRGHEAMFYLTYIIDHYDRLPDFMIFVHDHARAWHNSDVPDRSFLHLLADVRWSFVAERGYVNMRCRRSPNCPAIDQIHPSLFGRPGKMQRFFELSSPSLLLPGNGGGPIAAPCCAQFIVSRADVLRNELGFYLRARDWIVESEGTDWQIGRVFEYTWHIIFGRPRVDCPEEETCRKELYGYDRQVL